MLVDIQINEKSLDATLCFQLENFKDQKSHKDALAIVIMIAGDYSLDPEIELEDLMDIVARGKEEQVNKLIFTVNEEEIEAELAK